MDQKPSGVGAAGTDEQQAAGGSAATGSAAAAVLVRWLQRLQFKMGQIEMQASNVQQFFTV